MIKSTYLALNILNIIYYYFYITNSTIGRQINTCLSRSNYSMKTTIKITLLIILNIVLIIVLYVELISKKYPIFEIYSKTISEKIVEASRGEVHITDIKEHWDNYKLTISASTLRYSDILIINDLDIKIDLIKSILMREVILSINSKSIIVDKYALSKPRPENPSVIITPNVNFGTLKVASDKIIVLDEESSKIYKNLKVIFIENGNTFSATYHMKTTDDDRLAGSLVKADDTYKIEVSGSSMEVVNILMFIFPQNNLLKNIKAKGLFSAIIDIKKLPESYDFNIVMDPKGSDLRIKNINLFFQDINGLIYINKEKLSASLEYSHLGSRSKAKLSTENNWKEFVVKARGKVDTEEIPTLVSHKITKKISGIADYKATYKIIDKESILDIEVESSNIKMDFPSPIVSNKGLIKLLISLKDGYQESTITYYGNEVHYIINDNNIEVLQIKGSKKAPVNEDYNFFINGEFEDINIDEWLKLFPLNNKKPSDNDMYINIKSDSLLYKGIKVNNVGIVREKTNGNDHIQINSDEVVGVVDVSGGHTKIAVDYIVIDNFLSLSNKNGVNNSCITDNFGDVDLTINRFEYRNLEGDINMTSIHQDDGSHKVDLKNLKYGGFTARGPIIVSCKNTKFGDNSVPFAIESSNVNSLIDKIGFSGDIENFNSKIFLSWDDFIANIDYSTLSGAVNISSEAIEFDANPQLRALKLLNILNMEDLLKRITFDFDNVGKKTILFENMNASLMIENGIVGSNNDGIKFTGDELSFVAGGSFDLNKNTIDAKATLVTPVFNKIPVIGIITGLSLPIAGGLFLIDKVVGDKIDKVFSKEIKIKGNLDEIFNVQRVQTSPKKKR